MLPLFLFAVLDAASLGLWAAVRRLPFGPWAPALTALVGGALLLGAGVVPVEVLRLGWPPGMEAASFAALTALTLLAIQPSVFLAAALLVLIRGQLPPKKRIYSALVAGGPIRFAAVQALAVPLLASGEELAFRAILIGIGLSGDSTPLWVEALVAFAAALPFAAGHVRGGPVQMLGTLLSGLVFGASFLIAGTIWVPLVAHILHNWFWLAVLRRRYLADLSASDGQAKI